jgi:3D (Asp-Asp-Asp) domain-containing protein
MLFRAIFLLLCSIALSAQRNDSLAPPVLSDLKPIAFWATSYWVQHAETSATGIPLLDITGKALGPVLAKADWCAAALEGTVRVGAVTYNYVGSRQSDFVDCSEYFGLKVGYSRFGVARGPYGDGVSEFILVPYRTLAADPAFLKPGTAIFVPAAVGQRLPIGGKHDGYCFVGDRGGAITSIGPQTNRLSLF